MKSTYRPKEWTVELVEEYLTGKHYTRIWLVGDNWWLNHKRVSDEIVEFMLRSGKLVEEQRGMYRTLTLRAEG